MGLHSGEALVTADGYAGIDVHRAARIAASAHGGQIVVSATTRELVRGDLPANLELRELGAHRLRDLGGPEHLFPVVGEGLPREFPSLRTLDKRPTNLPAQPTPLIGRKRELEELGGLLREPRRRLVTLTGPGGSGKTRLALQAAADALDEFLDGVFFVSLEGLSDPQLVLAAIRLVETSMIRSEERPRGEPRFLMLETLREYARERLEEAGEAHVILRRHAAYFSGEPENAERFWLPNEASEKVAQVNAELENIRTALDWAHDAGSALELPLAILYQRSTAVFPTEGRVRLELALAKPSVQKPQLRARALAAVGGLARIQGDLPHARRYLEEGLRLYREIGDEQGQMEVLRRLTAVTGDSGEEEEALRLAREVEALARRGGDRMELGLALLNVGFLMVARGDYEVARELLDESLSLLERERAGVAEAFARFALARLAILEGRHDECIVQIEACLGIVEDNPNSFAEWVGALLYVLAAALASSGSLEAAVRVHAAFTQWREARGEGPFGRGLLARVHEHLHGGSSGPRARSTTRQP